MTPQVYLRTPQVRLKVEQAPDETFIEKMSRSFDFLGYQFGKNKLTVSKRTVHNHLHRLTQLYEQKKHLPNWQILFDNWFRS
ncbi:hypothetical protein CXF95_09815 [Paraglaciecola sp. MB-3u-78]|nr:hypothetical protein CXF95_09815 [Paraglaciecola sp. MB-3u-78]